MQTLIVLCLDQKKELHTIQRHSCMVWMVAVRFQKASNMAVLWLLCFQHWSISSHTFLQWCIEIEHHWLFAALLRINSWTIRALLAREAQYVSEAFCSQSKMIPSIISSKRLTSRPMQQLAHCLCAALGLLDPSWPLIFARRKASMRISFANQRSVGTMCRMQTVFFSILQWFHHFCAFWSEHW